MPRGYATGADRTVLLRWYASQPDPVVKAGDWIADVTYERSQVGRPVATWWNGHHKPTCRSASTTRPTTLSGTTCPPSAASGTRFRRFCRPSPTPTSASPYRSMVVYVNQSLVSRTPLTSRRHAGRVNAALIVSQRRQRDPHNRSSPGKSH